MPSEADFRREIQEAIQKTPNSFMYRIRDVYGTGQKPFDIFSIVSGKAYGIELKFMKTLGRFNFKDKVRPHQIESLNKVREAGGIGLLLLNYRVPLTDKQRKYYDIEDKKINIVFCMTNVKEPYNLPKECSDPRDLEIETVVAAYKSDNSPIKRIGSEWRIEWTLLS